MPGKGVIGPLRLAARYAIVALLLLGSPWTGPLSAQDAPDPEARLRALGLTLPAGSAPIANYVKAVRTGNLVFLAGHGECANAVTGKAGGGVSVDSAYASARRVGLCLLTSLKAEIGDLRKVKRVVRVMGMINSTPDFTDQPRIVNGCSDLLVAVFGERGRHARAAVGMVSLPQGITVEIEMVVEVAD